MSIFNLPAATNWAKFVLKSTYDTFLGTLGDAAYKSVGTGSGDVAAGDIAAANATKLSGIANGATANSSDSYLLNRVNHTGAQAISTITNLQTDLDAKAADSTVVHNTGAETIAGAKTFSSDIDLDSNKLLNVSQFSSPSGYFNFYSSGGNLSGILNFGNITNSNKTFALPDVSGTFTLNDATQTLTHKDLTDGTNIFPILNQNTTGNAATSTKLATARNINGTAFDGSAAISILSTTGMNEQSGTSYTLVLGDLLLAVRCTNASAFTLTIPLNSSVAFPVGTAIPIFQGGAGVVTVTAYSGVTFETPNGAATSAIGDFRVAFKRATDTWVIC